MKTVTVTVQWRGHAPIQHGRISSAARFREFADEYPDVAWSIVLEMKSETGTPASGAGLATARFLVDNAPEDRLHPGAVFELMEGRHVAVECEVVAD